MSRLRCVVLVWSIVATATLAGAQTQTHSEPSTTTSKRSYVGIYTAPVPAAVRAQLAALVPSEAGVLITHVLPDSPAGTKLKPFDVVVACDDRPLAGVGELRERIAAAKAGDRLEFTVVRRAKRVQVPVAVGVWTVPPRTRSESKPGKAERVANSLAANRGSGETRRREVTYSSGPIRNRTLLVTTRDGDEFQARAVEARDGKSEAVEFTVTADAIDRLPTNVSDSVAADVKRIVAGVGELQRRGPVVRFRVQPRSDGRKRSVVVLLAQPGEGDEYRTCEVERELDAGDALPVDELVKNETLARELELVGPAVREKIVAALRRYRVPPVRIDVREPQ